MAEAHAHKSLMKDTRFVNAVTISVVVGSFFILMLSIVPLWNASSLLGDFNYVFWAGHRTPEAIRITCGLLILVYAALAGMFFRRSNISAHSEQTIMMFGNVFITLFGLLLMIVSLPLEWQAQNVGTALMYHCDTDPITHRLYEYSQVLQNIRASPECAKKYSVEECAGYQESLPYTEYLKQMEQHFKCAGFCYKAPSKKTSEASLLATKSRVKRHTDTITPLALITEAADSEEHSMEALGAASGAASTYPPTLFSDANFQASCDGMAARDMQNFAGDIGRQTFFQGIYLILIAVCTGFLKLLGFCVRKDARSEV